jgi:predicted O-methyltransferase YrrM
MDWLKIRAANEHHIAKLESIIRASGELLEGNIMYIHATLNRAEGLIAKQKNIYHYAEKATKIFEIGFNAGHSALLMLLANPKSQLVCVDLGIHKYTRPCAEYLQLQFPGRLTVYYGDSTQVVPKLADTYKNTFDLLHVDGGHQEHIARADLTNCIPLAQPQNVVIFDDTDAKHLLDLWNGLIQQKRIREFTLPHPILSQSRSKHAIGTYLKS